MKESIDSYEEFGALWLIEGRSFVKAKPMIIELWRRKEDLKIPLEIMEKVF